MDLGTCYPCSKYILLVINLFFWLSGLAWIILGLYFLLQPEVQQIIDLFNLVSLPISTLEFGACLLILLGLIIFFIGLCGYCGAQQESRTCLILYMISVIFILLVEVGFFTIIALHYDQGRVMLKDHLISQLQHYNHLYPSFYERAVDSIQTQYHCCGMDSAYDYGTSYLPPSCCSVESAMSCTIHQVGRSGTPGCASSLIQSSLFWIKFFLFFQFGLSILAFIGVFMAICLCQYNMIYDGYTQTFYYV